MAVVVPAGTAPGATGVYPNMSRPSRTDTPPDRSRRRFLRSAALLGAMSIVPAKSVLWDRRQVEVTTHDAPLNALPGSVDGMKVCQISDLHRGPYVSEEMLRDVTQSVMALRPDLILVTGDFVSVSYEYISSCAAAMDGLSAPLGVYGVLGNHDHWTSAPAVAQRLKERGIPLLVNDSREIEKGLWLAGVDDLWSGNCSVPHALAHVPSGAATILMSHNPALLDDLGQDLLVLAGHTHGGQISLGWLTRVLTSKVTAGGRYMRGWYERGRSRLYVNRGIGVVGLPARFRSMPEITLFTLRQS